MNLIFSQDESGGIGKDNRLIYSIPSDLTRFKKLTTGNAVIMGRSTLMSLPDSKPLPNRMNVVLSRDQSFCPNNVMVCRNLDELFSLCRDMDCEIFVIGGESIYRQLEPYCSRAYVTLISGSSPADRHFTLDSSWDMTFLSEVYIYNSIEYRFAEFCHRNPLPLPSSVLF